MVSYIVNWLIGHMIIITPTSYNIIQVLGVEEEMRELLKEMAAEKRKMETNYKNHHKHFKNYVHDKN